MRRRLPRGDYPYYQITFVFVICVCNQDDEDGTDQTHRLPAFLPVDDTFEAADSGRSWNTRLAVSKPILCFARFSRFLS